MSQGVSVLKDQVLPRAQVPVTVLMPVRDGARWITLSLKSLLQQSYQNFEILLVDDGSKDDSVPIARSIAGNQVRVIRANGEGLARALAMGVRAADTEVIARMDVDDVAHPSRLMRQVQFLESSPEYVIVGTNFRTVNEQGRVIGRSRLAETDAAIRLRMLITNPFAHPSVVFRKSAVISVGNYWSPNSEPFPEDYHLWVRLAAVGQLANLGASLLDYRINNQGLSQTNRHLMRAHGSQISWGYMASQLNSAPTNARPKEAWLDCFGTEPRLGARQATLVLSTIVRARWTLRRRADGQGLLLRHYTYPMRRIVCKG